MFKLSLVLLLSIFIQFIQTAEFKSEKLINCHLTKECSENEFCTADPEKRIHGNCEKKFKKFCLLNEDCNNIEFCNLTNFNYGKCEKLKLSKHKKNFQTDINIPVLTKEEFENRPILQKDEENNNETICGNELISTNQKRKEDISQRCWNYGSCDDPKIRNNYTTRFNKYIKLQWIHFVCDDWHKEAIDRISEATYLINIHYLYVGLQFNSSLSLYPCTGSDGKQNYTTISVGQAVGAVPREKGLDWKKEGSIMIVVGKPVQENFNGFFYPPPSGYGFLNQRTIRKGYQTLSHEIGHALGLEHIFKGVSETFGCDGCREIYASDDTGDFCGDTPPIPRNFQCSSPLYSSDPCNSARWYWSPNPYYNLMSYGQCRESFSHCQEKRMRCYFQSEMIHWLNTSSYEEKVNSSSKIIMNINVLGLILLFLLV